MGVFARILGLCQTKPPADPACWSVDDHRVRVDLGRAPELVRQGGALRLEGKGLPMRLLVLRDELGVFHAVVNRCAHAGRRLDPIAGGAKLMCCSVGKSVFELDGHRVSGSAKNDIETLAVEQTANTLTVLLR